MAKFLRVEMPDGSQWDVPCEVIARNRADYYCGAIGQNNKAEFEAAMQDDETLLDWAINNMNWRDVENLAVQVLLPKGIDYQSGWVNGRREIVEK